MIVDKDSPNTSDGQLLRRYISEQSDAIFSQLVSRYNRLVYQACLRELRDRSLAEDASQAVFILLSRKAKALRNRDSIAGWLFNASRLVSRNMMKTEARRRSMEAKVAPSATEDRENSLWIEIEPHFNDALDRLKPSDREAVLLRFVQDLSLTEVGSMLGVSENTARMRVTRAIEKVRGHLQKAGVTVASALLATLIAEESTKAVPLLSFVPAGGGSATSASATLADEVLRKSLYKNMIRILASTGCAILFLGSGWNLESRASFRREASKRGAFFSQIDGSWKGILEYADDKSGEHNSYPTVVRVSGKRDGTKLALSATYAGSASEDLTTLEFNEGTGKFGVKNEGPMSSHRLAALGDLKATNTGWIFEGRNNSEWKYVRLTLASYANKLTIREEYRSDQAKEFTFRNQFSLNR